MSKVWGNIGAWAAEAERAEVEEKKAAAAAPPQSYPSLKEAVNTHKGKKKTKMTLYEFTMASSGGGSRLTPEEMMQYGRLGGGFTSYGGGKKMRDGDGAWGSNRRSYGGFSDDRRVSSPRVPEFDQPSRADEVDNWGTMKKSMTSSYDSVTRPDRYGGTIGGGTGGFSRAAEIDNLGAGQNANWIMFCCDFLADQTQGKDGEVDFCWYLHSIIYN